MAVANDGSPAAETDDPSTSGARPARCPACGGALGAALLQARDLMWSVPGSFSVSRCEVCALSVTLPLVDDEQLSSFYPTTYGAYSAPLTGALGLVSKGVQRVLAWQALRVVPLKRLAELAPGRLLDVGCGNGELGSWLVRRGWSVVGVEPSLEACALARKRGVDARNGILAEVELEPGAYDAVVFRHSLEHVNDPVADLRRVRSALREGGIAIVSAPNFDSWQRASFGERWFNLEVPRHRIHFNAASLHRTLAAAGFTQIATCTTTSSIALPASIQYALAGRFVFQQGLKLRIAIALCDLMIPASWLINRLAGGGDLLHAVAA
jgi:SAM-dependent methyltransferase